MYENTNNKLKIMWIAYQPIPTILKEIEPEKRIATGGWLQGTSDIILKYKDIELSYCFQYDRNVEGVIDGIKFFSMPVAPAVKRHNIEEYNRADYERFKNKINEIKPDVIHIYGTETWFQRQFAFMLYDLEIIDRTVVWIQGLVSFCSNVYSGGLDKKQQKRKTVWEWIRGTNVEGIENRLRINGIGECKELKILNNVFVRTDWDYACCKVVNSKLKFYRCNETLRPEFYENKVWDINSCYKHSIFMSQYTTPIKGYHQMLKALQIIIREFPDTVLYVTGENILDKPKSVIGKLRESSYIKILREEIISRSLQNNVRFLGTLMGAEMRDAYIKANVFVSASTIENSPNSVGEAMILGVPIVASDVGGVSSMLTKDVDGLLYPFSEYAMLAENICRIFKDNKLASILSQNARERALKTHNQKNNYDNLLVCYKDIEEKSKSEV